MAEREIDARVFTKVDTLENWNNNPLPLGPGEMALVTTPSGIPLNMKWGDKTTRKRFSDLPFAIAYDQGQFVAVSGPGALPTPENDVAYSLVGPGTYTFGGTTITAPEGRLSQLLWNGSTWSLIDMGELPDNSSKIPDAESQPYQKWAVVSKGGSVFRAKVATSQVPGEGSDWEFINGDYWNNLGYLSKTFGSIIESNASSVDYRSSDFLKITDRNNLVVTGYSGLNNNVALVSFYDKEFKFIGYYNPDTPGEVSYIEIDPSLIPNTAYYIRCTRGKNQFGLVKGVDIDLSIVSDQKRDKNKEWVFNDKPGYLNKIDGTFVSNTEYKVSKFLKIIDRNNLSVSGYSGVDNNLSLVVFYDKYFKVISTYNAPTHGLVSNHVINASSIPANAVYLKITTFRNVTEILMSGLDFRYTIEAEEASSLIDVNSSTALNKNSLFNNDSYIRKQNGVLTPATGYQSSDFLEITDRNNLVVTGFSGTNNNVALAFFYAEDKSPISAYNLSTQGVVFSHKIAVQDIPVDAKYIRISKENAQGFNFNGADVSGNVLMGNYSTGYINKQNGLPSSSSEYEFSGLYKITDKNNIVVKAGYSGANNNASLVAFYDVDMKYVGYYNVEGTNGPVYNISVPSASVPSTAVYLRSTKAPGQLFTGISGASRVLIEGTKDVDLLISSNSKKVVESYFEVLIPNSYSELGYIHKFTGRPTQQYASTNYRHSVFLRINDRNNLIVTGFSGTNNNVAIASFYDKEFKFIGYYNSDVAGRLDSHKIPENKIPKSAVYVVLTRTNADAVKYSGASPASALTNVIKKPENTKNPPRSGRTNVDFGGHVKLINYLGNDQNIHPKVLYFDTPWNGYKYWMAYTPYPDGLVEYENPCIAASHDGEYWESPNGMVNPLDTMPNSDSYNNDTHLVFNSSSNTLECWWRVYHISTAEVTIKRRVSTDGVNWGSIEVVFAKSNLRGDFLSPAIIKEGEKYKVWYCHDGKIFYFESTGVGAWTDPVILPITWGNVFAWHMDVIKTDKGYEYLVQGWELPGFKNNFSDLYYILQTDDSYTTPKKIVERGDRISDPDYQGLYRSSILYVNDIYSIYYTGISDGLSSRALFLTKGRSLEKLVGVNL